MPRKANPRGKRRPKRAAMHHDSICSGSRLGTSKCFRRNPSPFRFGQADVQVSPRARSNNPPGRPSDDGAQPHAHDGWVLHERGRSDTPTALRWATSNALRPSARVDLARRAPMITFPPPDILRPQRSSTKTHHTPAGPRETWELSPAARPSRAQKITWQMSATHTPFSSFLVPPVEPFFSPKYDLFLQ